MKKLILNTVFALLLTLTATMSFADVIKFEKCSKQDIALLSASHNFEIRGVRTIIQDEVLPKIVKCEVRKPYQFMMVPAVCGYLVKNVSEYKIKTENGTKYETTVDTSHVSCQRSRRVPYISTFGFKVKMKRNTDDIRM
jgi:hypothetical protein